MNKQQSKPYTQEEYKAAGCSLFRGTVAETIMAVHEMTGGKLCTTGCADYNGGRCAAFQKLENGAAQKVVAAGGAPVETVREMAARLNISLSEARRQRQGA